MLSNGVRCRLDSNRILISNGGWERTSGAITSLLLIFSSLFLAGKFRFVGLTPGMAFSLRTPTFCESLSASVRGQEFQCSSGDHFGLIVHGLWPQVSRASSVRDHPRNCRDENQLNTTMVKRYFCMIPDEDQIQSQWEKHGQFASWTLCSSHLSLVTGTCHYRSAAEYYATIEKLFQSLKLPQIQSMKNPTDASIKSALINLNSKLFSSAVRISMESTNRLKEIKICYNFALQPISCYT